MLEDVVTLSAVTVGWIVSIFAVWGGLRLFVYLHDEKGWFNDRDRSTKA